MFIRLGGVFILIVVGEISTSYNCNNAKEFHLMPGEKSPSLKNTLLLTIHPSNAVVPKIFLAEECQRIEF